MKRAKRFLAVLVLLSLCLGLSSCAQGEVNGDRLPGGQGGQASGGTQAPTDGGGQSPTDGSTQSPLSGWVPPSLDNWDPEDPYGFNFFVEIEGSTFEDTRVDYPPGTVLYTVTSAGLYDSLADTGISEESYAASGAEKYDHYVKVDITVQNVDITETEDYLINSFGLTCRLYPLREAVWFSLGGVADDARSHYFYYHLPPTGESIDVSVAWGLWDWELSELREAGGIWLTYGLNIWQKMKLEGLL